MKTSLNNSYTNDYIESFDGERTKKKYRFDTWLLNHYEIIAFAFIICLAFAGLGSAVACNADLSNVLGGTTLGCTLDTGTSLTLNGTYNKNINTSTNGRAIAINGNNIYFNCNGTTIYGNHTDNTATSITDNGIYVGYATGFNITIVNCNLHSYYYDIRTFANKNVTLINVTLLNSVYGLYVENTTTLKLINSVIQNSSINKFGLSYVLNSKDIYYENITFKDAGQTSLQIYNSSGVYIKNSTFNGTSTAASSYILMTMDTGNTGSYNVTLDKLTFYKSANSMTNPAISFTKGTDLNIYNITCYSSRCFSGFSTGNNFFIDGMNILGDYDKVSDISAIATAGSSNGLIQNINISNINNSIMFNSKSNNITLRNSWFYNKTRGGNNGFILVTSGAMNINFYNNTVQLTDYAFFATNAINVTYKDNNISRLTLNYDGWGTGFLIDKNITGIVIENNNINFTNYGIILRMTSNSLIKNNRFSEDTNNAYSLFDMPSSIAITGLIQTWTGDSTEVETDNISKISNYSSYNVNITGNTFDSSVQVFLYTQGTYNLTHDLDSSTFWKRSFQAPASLVNRTDLYISNNFNQITGNRRQDNLWITMFGQGYKTPFAPNFTNYTWIKNQYDFYKNIYSSPQQYKIFDQINSLITTSNGSPPCGNSLFTGDCNVTLNASSSAFVFNNASIYDNMNIPNFPIWIKYKDINLLTIASNLSQPINMTVYTAVDTCTKLQGITLNDSTLGIYYNIPTSQFSCDSTTSIVTIYNVTIDNSSQSTYLSFSYYPTQGGGGGGGSSTSNSVYNDTLICNNVYTFLSTRKLVNSFNYTVQDLDVLANEITQKQLTKLSTAQLIPYVENYNTKCLPITKKTLEFYPLEVPADPPYMLWILGFALFGFILYVIRVSR